MHIIYSINEKGVEKKATERNVRPYLILASSSLLLLLLLSSFTIVIEEESDENIVVIFSPHCVDVLSFLSFSLSARRRLFLSHEESNDAEAGNLAD